MLLRLLSIVVLTVFSTQSRASEPNKAPIRFPEIQVAPAPAPGPVPVSVLTGELLYVIDSDIELIVLSSPQGLVSIASDIGPLRMRGRFVDGTGVETRNYKGKFIYTINAAGVGQTELIVIPSGVTKAGDIVRKTLDVNDGTKPIPPPVPPKPDPDPVVKADRVWLIVVEETSQRTPAISRVIGDASYWGTQLSKGNKFRFYDVDSAEAKASGYDTVARGVGLPALIIVDQSSGKALKVLPLPGDTAGIDSVVKEVTK